MFSVDQSDLLKALKGFRRLAKQDFLASPMTSDPHFWHTQASARRAQYDALMQSVQDHGVDAAFRLATRGYTAMPLCDDERPDPYIAGREQAYEMFFVVLGVSPKARERLRNARRRRPWPLHQGQNYGERKGGPLESWNVYVQSD